MPCPPWASASLRISWVTKRSPALGLDPAISLISSRQLPESTNILTCILPQQLAYVPQPTNTLTCILPTVDLPLVMRRRSTPYSTPSTQPTCLPGFFNSYPMLRVIMLRNTYGSNVAGHSTPYNSVGWLVWFNMVASTHRY